jgi:hypothetical protein
MPRARSKAQLCHPRAGASHDLAANAPCPAGAAALWEWKKKIGSISLVAISGITLERVRAVIETGADGAVVAWVEAPRVCFGCPAQG